MTRAVFGRGEKGIGSFDTASLHLAHDDGTLWRRLWVAAGPFQSSHEPDGINLDRMESVRNGQIPDKSSRGLGNFLGIGTLGTYR